MKKINIYAYAGSFAENKDRAREIRLQQIIPAIERGEYVVLDFTNVDDATQSFIHALISDLFRKFGNQILGKLEFKSCSETVKKIIEIVTDYMQESSPDETMS